MTNHPPYDAGSTRTGTAPRMALAALIVAVLIGAVVAITFAVRDDDGGPVASPPSSDESRSDAVANGGPPDRAPDLATANARGDLNITVVAEQWNWTFNYAKGGTTVNQTVWETGSVTKKPTVWLVEDKSVTFDLYSPDVIHSFWPRDLLFKMDVVPGRAATNYFTVTPTESGAFVGRCAELCGINHSKMLFDVKVVSQEAFDAHLQELQAAEQTGLNAPPGYAEEISGS